MRQEETRFAIEYEREEDGRWLAEVIGFPGVLAYGKTFEEAVTHAQALSLRVIADRIEHDETPPALSRISFATVAS